MIEAIEATSEDLFFSNLSPKRTGLRLWSGFHLKAVLLMTLA